MFLLRFLRLLLVPVLFMATLSTATLQADDDLTDEQLHAVMGIIVNFILSDEPKHFAIISESTVTVAENQTFAIDINVKDATGAVTYAISGGDAGEFSIDASTGVITFNNAPDFETRTTYTFTVTATDAYGNASTQEVSINISDVVENVGFKKTGQTKSYDAGGNEVTDGSIKDDGYYQKGVTPSYTRDDVNNIVTDHITGLQWQDNAEAKTITKDWADAQTYCSSLSLDGGGWRLPTVQELQSIVVDGAYNPSIDTTAFVNYISSDGYWSSTTYANYTSSAWIVGFSNGSTDYSNKTTTSYVRCVR